MIRGIIGKKVGMTQIFNKEGMVVPVTVIEAGPCTILELKDSPAKVKIGFEQVKETRLPKPQQGYFKKIGLKPVKRIKEFYSSDNAEYEVGQELKADFFQAGDYVDVSGSSIGKGFQGGMKRHNWGGGPAGHGSMHHRRVGSIGACATPSKVVKGFPMPGQMGNRRVTTQGLRVMDIDVENNLIMVKGAIPGSDNGYVEIYKSRKKAFKSLDEKRAVEVKKVNPMKQSKAKAGKKKGGK